MSRLRLIIDTDPGQDDALALLLALASPDELEVLGVTVVAGNAPLELTEANARRIVELAGRPDVPVRAGCAGPLLEKLRPARSAHGESGLDGVDLPPPTLPLADGHGVDWLVETLLAAEAAPVTLATLGPLTNIAMALAKEPRIRRGLAEIVAMGGACFTPGNSASRPNCEFNIKTDPEAAALVLESGVPLVLVPLDVTHKALATPPRVAGLLAAEGPRARAAAQIINFYGKADRRRTGWAGGPLHDPCVIAYLLRPELFHGKHVWVGVERMGELTRGMTVCDWWGTTGRRPNAMVMHDIDADGFYALLTERLTQP